MRKVKRKILGVILTLAMVLGMCPVVGVYADGQEGNSASISVSFRSGSEERGLVQVKNGDSWTDYSTGSVEAEAVRIRPNQGYSIDWAGIELRVENSNIITEDIRNQLVSDEGYTLESGKEYALENVEFKSDDGSGENPAPNPGGNEECIGFAFEGEMGTDYSALVANGIQLYVAVSSDDAKPAGSQFKELNSLVGSNVTQAGSAYKFDSSVSQVYAYLKYDTGKYMSQAGYGSQINIGVGYENASKISATGINTIQVDKIHYTVTWAYDAKRFGEDAYLEHGKAYITAINGVSVDKLTFDAIWGDNPGNAEGGNLAVEAGSTVTVKLIPDYGYQLKSVSLNGNELTPQSDVSTFTFKMPATQVHFKGAFEKSTDVITTQGDTVANAIINNASNATDSGNISLEVKDNSTYKTEDAEALVTDSLSAEAVDLNLNQIVSKGNGSSWETAITEFSKPVTLTLGLKNYDSSYDYTVVRNHNGQLTKLDTTVSNGKVSFETNQFSTYIIVKSEKKKTSIIGKGSKIGEGAPETKLSQSADELLGLIGLTNNELAAIKEMGADADITLGIESTNPSSQELALIKNVLGKNSVAEYYDISLLLKVEGLSQRQITDPDGKIKIAITIPEKFLNTDKNVKRTYRMVRIHDGKATVIEGSFDAVTKQFTFETDAFSTYALVYEDTAVEAKTNITKPANTDTKPTTKVKKAVKGGDSNNLLVWYTVLLLGVAGITAATLYRKCKNK